MATVRRIGRVIVLLVVTGSIFLAGLALAAQPTTVNVFGAGKSPSTVPGKGCGDPNHYHERENECKKPPR